jgi:predicted membrane protein
MITGIILILLGGLLIASNTGLIPYDFKKIIVSWQMLLIIVGIMSIAKRQTFHFHGLLLICIGIFFIIPKVAKVFPSVFSCIDSDNFIAIYWPLVLIFGGIILILRIFTPGVHSRRHWHTHKHYKHCRARFRENFEDGKKSWKEEKYTHDEDFSKSSIFGGGKYIVVDTEFEGGTVQAIFGGIELDLRKAYLPEGETILNIEAIFGGVELFVPDSWLLEVKIESVLGGVDDNRRITEVTDTSRKLIIKGSAVFGGIEINN